MTRIIKGGLLNLIVAILIAGLASNALSEETKRPGELAGCDPKLIDRLLAVMEVEIIPVMISNLSKWTVAVLFVTLSLPVDAAS